MKWLTVREARMKLSGKVSAPTIYRLLRNGKLRGTQIAGRVLVEEGSLDELIFAGSVRVRSNASPGRKGRRKSRAA